MIPKHNHDQHQQQQDEKNGDEQGEDKDDHVVYSEHKTRHNNETTTTTTTTIIHAIRVDIRSVHHCKQYLARLFSFSLDQLYLLFAPLEDEQPQTSHSMNYEQQNNHSLPNTLVKACASPHVCRQQLEALHQHCQQERKVGRSATLWKSPLIQELSNVLVQQEQHQQHHKHPPRVSKRSLDAVRRLEQCAAEMVSLSSCCRIKSSSSFVNENDSNDNANALSGPTTSTVVVVSSSATTPSSNGTQIAPRRQEQEEQSPDNDLNDKDCYNNNNNNTFDPIHDNLPNLSDQRRIAYMKERKGPQVQCMLQLIRGLLARKLEKRSTSMTIATTETTPSRSNVLRILDVGGGRGYLGIAVADAYDFRKEQGQQLPTRIHVTVVDNNTSSLQAGRHCAEKAGLLVGSSAADDDDHLDDADPPPRQMANIDFVHCDLSDAAAVKEKLLLRMRNENDDDEHGSVSTTTARRPFDVVIGLHCCGGLAEAAVELAIQCVADFCVSTCCFRSNPALASLTHLAQDMVVQQMQHAHGSDNHDDKEFAAGYKRDVMRVAALAVTVGGKGQHDAIRVYNCMRLAAAQKRFEWLQQQHRKSETKAPVKRFRTWQETFPVEYSVQNRVLMGTID